MRKRRLLPILLVGWWLVQLTGCIHVPTSFKNLSPDVRRRQLSRLNDWQVTGSLSIHSPQQAVIARYSWQQRGNSYDITLKSSLNLMQIKMTGTVGQFVKVCRSSDHCVKAAAPAALLQEALGWSAPIEYLRYWIRGMAVPNQPAFLEYDRFGHITSMRQYGFSLWFSKYTPYDGVDLPRRIDLQYPTLQMRLIISEWNI
jgi:outer membrane lipoprotein LolB